MSSRGQRLVEAMQRRGIQKQLALAYTLGVNDSTISRWKRGGPISVESAIALCQTLDVSLDWFLVGQGSIDQRKQPSDSLSMEDARLLELFRSVTALMTETSKRALGSFMGSLLAG